MSEQVEIEFKNMLTQSEYKKLLHLFQAKEDDFFYQSNTYFDTPDWQLKIKKAGLRIRLLPEYAELTLKTPLEKELLETTDTLSLEEGKQLIQQGKIKDSGFVFTKLISLGIDPTKLRLLGSLATTRYEQKTKKGLFVLDHSIYCDQEDYELEFETTHHEEGNKFFQQFLLDQGIPLRPSKHKIARMIEANNQI
ncbi:MULTISPECIES: CYTH domain-containing protein [Carnobacterium]|uniref:CYTH domain-containing protein n=1 Tax=Carnobacterium TaxID=2747 RepID=UPI0028905620|nr:MULTISPECIES: CYTH domain-containing protein [Carnobacterium]MDT1938567.1 CYTH domain-containing protein [Carnobacterium divergens]MDT1941005.1 CYTH domain-containing protein [Carnobacterium divergens]MDT1946803.1 CYTH domain-containing protein [Carnobacterium divergens]MDT1949240.1 CYTH domain-containing protein [Carnobacterium divergens]MDT1954418.1 CYTH domain-containing protein [Carnobacterium divergens]